MTIKESIELISKIESLCNGNVSMLERYVNVSGKDEFESLLKCGILNKRYNVQILDLETEIINMLPKEVVIKAVYEHLRCYDYNKIIEKYNIINLINSKYADELNNLMSTYKYQFMPEVSHKGEYTYDSYYNRDYLIKEDLEQIKKNEEDDLFIARYFDDKYRCFNNLDFFQHFEKEILRNDFQKILYISMNAKKSIIERRGMIVCYLANIPIFADTIEFNECWDAFYSIFKQFISASLI